MAYLWHTPVIRGLAVLVDNLTLIVIICALRTGDRALTSDG